MSAGAEPFRLAPGVTELPAEPEAIAVAAAETARLLDEARLHLEAGGTVALAGLETRLAVLHAAVAACGESAGADSLGAPLQALADSLARLEAALKARRPQAVPTRPSGRVAAAYGGAIPPDKPARSPA